MKICLLGNNLTVKSGHARPAYVLARELIAQGHEVTIMAERLDPARLAIEEGQLAQLGRGDLVVERRFSGLPELALGGNELIRSLWRRLGTFDVMRAFGGAFPLV